MVQKRLNGFLFGIKTPEGLQQKVFESILNPIPALMNMGCCMLCEKHLDCFVQDHSPNFCKRWLVDEIINFYIFWMCVFEMNFLVYSFYKSKLMLCYLFLIHDSKANLSKRFESAQTSSYLLLL